MVRPVTTALIAAAFLLTITWPFELRDRPNRRSPLAVRQAYASRLALHTGGIVLTLIGAGVGAALISRQAKREYREASLRNLKTLVESPLPSAKKREDGEGSL